MRSRFAYVVAVVLGLMTAATLARGMEVEFDGSDDATALTRWNFVEQSSGASGAYDATFGDTEYGGIRIGACGMYSTSYAQGGPSGIDLDKAFLFHQEASIGSGNDPGIEFAWMEQGNALSMAIPESGTGNATAMVRSVTIAGPYAATNDIVTCGYWTEDTFGTDPANIDCDTSTTGSDLFVEDDLEIGGVFFVHDNVCFEGATKDGYERCFNLGSDPTSDVTVTMPNTGTVTSTTENATITGTRTFNGDIDVDSGASFTVNGTDNDRKIDLHCNTLSPGAPASGYGRFHCESGTPGEMFVTFFGEDEGRMLIEITGEGLKLIQNDSSTTPPNGYSTIKARTDQTLDFYPDGGSSVELCSDAYLTGCTAADDLTGTIPAARVGDNHIDALTEIGDLCAAGEVIKRNSGDTAWECASAGGGSGPTRLLQATDDVHSGGTAYEYSTDLTVVLDASTTYLFNGTLIAYAPSGGSDVSMTLACTAGSATAGEIYYGQPTDGGSADNGGTSAIGGDFEILAGSSFEWRTDYNGWITASGSGCTLEVGVAEVSNGSGVVELRAGSWLQISTPD